MSGKTSKHFAVENVSGLEAAKFRFVFLIVNYEARKNTPTQEAAGFKIYLAGSQPKHRWIFLGSIQ